MKQLSKIFLIIIISMWFFKPVLYAVDKSIQLAGKWPLNYSAKDIIADNERHYLYLGNGDRIVILDPDLNLISNTKITDSGQIGGMFYSGEEKYVYIACKNDGLKILDVSDVEDIREVGNYHYPNASVEFTGVYADNQKAFLACDNAGLLILDVSNPVKPSLLQEVELPGAWVVFSYAIDAYASGNYVWVADLLNGIRIVNIADINNPKLTNILLPNVRDISVSGSYMYACLEANGMDIINISDPDKPKDMCKYLTSGHAEAVCVDNNFAYVAYDFGSAGIRILDVTDKAKPVANKKWAYTDTDARSIAMFANDTSAYIISDKVGLKKIDASDKTNMHSVKSFDIPAGAVAIDINENYIYAVDNNVGDLPGQEGLRIFQIDIPYSGSVKLYLTGFCATPGEASDVVVVGGNAYVADGNNGLQIIDIGDKSNPKIIGNVSIPGFANSVYVNLNYAYISSGSEGVAIVNVLNPATASIVGSVNTSGEANAVFISGDDAYIANGSSGLMIVGVKDKSHPRIISTTDISGIASDIYVENNYAYMAAGKQGFVIVNIADKTNPTVASSYNTPGNAKKISVAGNYAYVADGDQGVCVINISDKAHPVKDTYWSFDAGKGHAGVALDVVSGYSDANESLYEFIADGPAGVVSVNLTATEDNNNTDQGGGGGGGCFIRTLFN